MLSRKDNQFELCPYKVRYTQHGEEIEQWALPNKEWWIDFEQRWEHTEIIEFTELELSDEQLARFEEIKYMPEDFTHIYEEYVLSGGTSNDVKIPTHHPFQTIRLQAANNALADENEMLGDTVDFILVNVIPSMIGGGE